MKYNSLLALCLASATLAVQAGGPEVVNPMTLDSSEAVSIQKLFSPKTGDPRNLPLDLKSIALLNDGTYTVEWTRETKAVNGVKLSGYQQTFTKDANGGWQAGTLSAPFIISWTSTPPGGGAKK
jgi:hypothetical protein